MPTPKIQISAHDRILDANPSRIRRGVLGSAYQIDTPSRQITRQIGRAAVAGFGFSLGRDVYRLAKRLLAVGIYLSIPFLWLILPVIAGRLLVRRKSVWDYVAGVLSLIAGGLACTGLAALLTQHSLIEPQPTSTAAFVTLSFILLAAGLSIGIWKGIGDRDVRDEILSVAERNRVFLEQNGLRETGGKHITHYDDYDTPLRFLEAHNDRLLFMVVGARGKRAQ